MILLSKVLCTVGIVRVGSDVLWWGFFVSGWPDGGDLLCWVVGGGVTGGEWMGQLGFGFIQ